MRVEMLSANFNLNFIELTPQVLPNPWLHADIGTVGVQGDAIYTPSTFSVFGSGTDISGQSDKFHYAYQQAAGDCELVARVTAVENTNAGAKAGVMIRGTSIPDSRHFSIFVTPSQGVIYSQRTNTGGFPCHRDRQHRTVHLSDERSVHRSEYEYRSHRLSVNDMRSDATSLAVTATSSQTTLVPNANIVIGGSGAHRTVTVTPLANQLGASTIAITVSDGIAHRHRYFALTVAGSGQETWRFAHFGTTANTGTAADSHDANNDGENNLLEFATGQNPLAGAFVKTPWVRNGDNLEMRYPCGKAAIAAGMTFQVEWSDSLAVNSWSSAGVHRDHRSEEPGRQ